MGCGAAEACEITEVNYPKIVELKFFMLDM